MKVFFDTSVLVAAVVDQLRNHEAALDCFSRYVSGKNSGFCSAHTIAECCATLTALPLKRRIMPQEAKQLIAENFSGRLTVVEIKAKTYDRALERVSNLGLTSGIIYDALHLECAELTKCSRLYTYNIKHFQNCSRKKLLLQHRRKNLDRYCFLSPLQRSRSYCGKAPVPANRSDPKYHDDENAY